VARDTRDIAMLILQGWRVLIVWECALRGKMKLNDAGLTERLEEWICGGGQAAQIDTQGIHLLRFLRLTRRDHRFCGQQIFAQRHQHDRQNNHPNASHSTGDSVSPRIPSRAARPPPG
jgi:hypothetical protein